ncbi:MAG: energy transducer TonB [Saprospiraceae bacterium]|nr:energy transducer TonB [Saprospiraceae bacterium]
MKAFFKLTLYLFLLSFLSNLYAQDSSGIYRFVEIMPHFPGCESLNIPESEKKLCSDTEFMKFIYGNIDYPKSAQYRSIEGMVIIDFTVDTSGNIVDIETIKNPVGGEDLVEEVMRILRLMKDQKAPWSPGIQQGKKVKVRIRMPIKFNLGDSDTKRTPSPFLIPPPPSNYKTYEYAYSLSCEKEEGSPAQKTCTENYLKDFLYSQLDENHAKKDKVNRENRYIKLLFLVDENGQIIDLKILEGWQFGNCILNLRLNVSSAKNKSKLRLIPFKGDGKAVRGIYKIQLDMMEVLKKKK